MNYLTKKSINEILDYKFFIPACYRGYQWSEQQVEDVLNGIDNFNPIFIGNSDNKAWCCLQPIIISECDYDLRKKNCLEGTWYKVISGHKQLITIFLIIHYINDIWIGKPKIPAFRIKYDNCDKIIEFLQKLSIDDKSTIDYSNQEFFKISKSYNKIHAWIKNYQEIKEKEFDFNYFLSKFKYYSNVIWHEVIDKNGTLNNK